MGDNNLDNTNLINNMVRVGIVTDVDKRNRRVRVHFPNLKMTSGWLYVLKSPTSIQIIFEFTADAWMPEINDKVLCLYSPVFNGDGFVLGGI